MPVNPTDPKGPAHISGQVPAAPALVVSAAKSQPDLAAAAQDLQAVEAGGLRRRFNRQAILPTGFLGDLAGDLGALLRAGGLDIQPSKVPNDLLRVPSRGGVQVKTSEGWLQLGMDMWINKDLFAAFAAQGGFGISKDDLVAKLPHMIPTIILMDLKYVPHFLAADFIQYLFFVTKGNKFTIVAPDAQVAADLGKALDLSYEGPRSEALSRSVAAEYPAGAVGIPDMLAELTRGFGGSPPAGALREIAHLDESGEFSFGNVVVRKLADLRYEIIDNLVSLGVIDLADYPLPGAVQRRDPDLALNPALQEVRRKILIEGRPGVIAWGVAHGFAVNEETSGFMITNGGRGVLVDPPSSTLDQMMANGFPLEMLDGLILTHGHTDHYGDSVLKILRRCPQLKVYTTHTNFNMLQEQYILNTVAGKNEGLTQWNFVPVMPQTFTEIIGLHFRFEYGFHTVPTVGFDVHATPDLQSDPIFFFTGDTFADPAGIWQHTRPGPNGEPPVMTMQRAYNVTRHRDYVMGARGRRIAGLIEAGIAPIHTDPASTKELLDAAKGKGVDTSRIFVYHIAKEAADKAGVPQWTTGYKGFIDLSESLPSFTPGNEHDYARRQLERMPLLEALDETMRNSLLRYGELQFVQAGQKLLVQGENDRKIYALIDGEVQVSHNGDVITSRPNGLFGEAALLGEPRNADVTTTVPSLVLVVDVDDLPARIIQPLRTALQGIRDNRANGNYEVVKHKSVFAGMPDSILDVLFLKGIVNEIPAGERFITEGDTSQDVYLVLKGNVHVTKADGSLSVTLKEGALLGEMALIDGAKRRASATADEGGIRVLRLSAPVMRELSTKYPGVSIALNRTAEQRLPGRVHHDEARDHAALTLLRQSVGELALTEGDLLRTLSGEGDPNMRNLILGRLVATQNGSALDWLRRAGAVDSVLADVARFMAERPGAHLDLLRDVARGR